MTDRGEHNANAEQREADAVAERDALVAREFLWAALDCPGAFAQLFPPPAEAIVLGEMSARIDADVAIDEPCIAIGWQIADLGRRRVVGTALLRSSGEVIAVAQATWFIVSASVFN